MSNVMLEVWTVEILLAIQAPQMTMHIFMHSIAVLIMTVALPFMDA